MSEKEHRPKMHLRKFNINTIIETLRRRVYKLEYWQSVAEEHKSSANQHSNPREILEYVRDIERAISVYQNEQRRRGNH
jgi:hypothetical protein